MTTHASSPSRALKNRLAVVRGRDRCAVGLTTCAVNRVCVISLSGAVVLMEQSTKTISALHRTGRQRDHAGWFMGSALGDQAEG